MIKEWNLVHRNRIFYLACMITAVMKKTILFWIASGGMVLGALSQEVYYYGVNSRPVENVEEAILRKEVDYRKDQKLTITTAQLQDENWVKLSREKIRATGPDEWVIRYRAEKLFSSKFYRDYSETAPGHFFFKEYSLTNTIRTGNTAGRFPLFLEGTVTEYYPNGAVRSVAEYRDNQLISNKNWLEDGTPYIDSIFYSADQEPEYEYGPDFFKNYLIQKLIQSEWDLSQIQDRVVIGWVVMETGELKGIRALEGKSEQLNNYLIKTISEMPGKWQSARLHGKPVRYFMSIPLNFDVRDINFQELDYSTGRLYYDKY